MYPVFELWTDIKLTEHHRGFCILTTLFHVPPKLTVHVPKQLDPQFLGTNLIVQLYYCIFIILLFKEPSI